MVKDMPNKFSEVTPEIKELAKKCNKKIDEELFAKYDVKRGLRKRNGEGVLAGLTDISMINAYTMIDREIVPCEGKLYYRGIDIEDIVKGFIEEDRFGFEETAYLLLFGELPKKDQLKQFEGMLGEYRQLPTNFVRDIIMKAPSCDMMNTLARSVLTLFSYDDNASDISLPNVLRQCIQLIALFPVLSVYAYQAYNHYERGESLFIHLPDPELSTAENILHLLRPDSKYTKLEAKLLDMALVLHAEHGGGNNSTFTTHVVSSSGTDTYSAIAAALCSLKGPKHGGANIKVVQMFDDLKAHPHKRRDTKPYSQHDNPQNRSSDYKRLIECEASCPTKHPCQHPSDLEAAMGTALQIIGSSVIYVDRYERFQQELESLYQ